MLRQRHAVDAATRGARARLRPARRRSQDSALRENRRDARAGFRGGRRGARRARHPDGVLGALQGGKEGRHDVRAQAQERQVFRRARQVSHRKRRRRVRGYSLALGTVRGPQRGRGLRVDRNVRFFPRAAPRHRPAHGCHPRRLRAVKRVE